MRIKKIKIKEYKQFKNLEINFKDGLNLIVGAGGTGKTILFSMLKEGILNKNENYDVETDEKIDKRHVNYIFVDLGKFSGEVTNKYNEHIPYSSLAYGEKMLMTLDMVLGYRKKNKIQAPLILDSPTGYLDSEKRLIFFKILSELNEQVIVFLRHEMELSNTGLYPNFKLIQNKDEDKWKTTLNKVT